MLGRQPRRATRRVVRQRVHPRLCLGMAAQHHRSREAIHHIPSNTARDIPSPAEVEAEAGDMPTLTINAAEAVEEEDTTPTRHSNTHQHKHQ